LPILRGLIGRSENQARALLGRLLKLAGDDCAHMLQKLREAKDLRPAEPIAWLNRAVACGSRRQSSTDAIREKWGLPSSIDASFMDRGEVSGEKRRLV
jgi:hypothetical protein